MTHPYPEWDNWDIEGIERVLQTEAEPCVDPLCGDGLAFKFTQSPELPKPTLLLFPDRFIVRYRSLNAFLDIGQAILEPETDRIKVESNTAMMESKAYFLPRGTILFTNVPDCKYPPSEEVFSNPKRRRVGNKEANKKDRVTLTGIVGTDPVVEATKDGKKVLKFSVAVDEAEETKCHSVFFFGDRADAVAGKVSKGRAVSIIGYKHEQKRTVKGPDGPIKTTTEVIFGFSVSGSTSIAGS